MLIECQQVKRTFQMGKTTVEAARGIDLEIEESEFCAIVGPSGSGKSTLMHLIGTLDTPTSGKIVIDGKEVSIMSDGEKTRLRASTIGFVFQTFNLINHLSVLDNVTLVMRFCPSKEGNKKERARKLLERVGLEDRVTHKPVELSGGERQRVAIARALANNPKIVLADEPTGNLDSKTGEQIGEMLKELNSEGVTIIMVTHDLELAKKATRVIKLQDGLISSKN